MRHTALIRRPDIRYDSGTAWDKYDACVYVCVPVHVHVLSAAGRSAGRLHESINNQSFHNAHWKTHILIDYNINHKANVLLYITFPHFTFLHLLTARIVQTDKRWCHTTIPVAALKEYFSPSGILWPCNAAGVLQQMVQRMASAGLTDPWKHLAYFRLLSRRIIFKTVHLKDVHINSHTLVLDKYKYTTWLRF